MLFSRPPREPVRPVLLADDVYLFSIGDRFLDRRNVRDFEVGMASTAAARPRVVLDLRRVEFVDSYGIAAILAALQSLQSRGGELKVCGLTPPVRALFEMVRLHRALDILNTLDEARLSFQDRSASDGSNHRKPGQEST